MLTCNRYFNKMTAQSVTSTIRSLTQPTEIAEDWAGDILSPTLRPGGIPSGRFCLASWCPAERPFSNKGDADENPK